VKVFVDTAAVMEKPLAQAAGLGWQGKHTNLVSREFGSWLFLGAIFSASDLPRDAADDDHCGSCTPARTSARPRRSRALQARCAALHLLSHHRAQGPIPREFRKPSATASMAATIASRSVPGTSSRRRPRAKLSARAELRAPRLAELARLDDAAFRALFRNRRSSASAATALSAMC
jgi:epoxyqueuosine reductase